MRPAIAAAVVLNRSPLLTRTPSLFERAYYAYQARIRRALHNPFPYDFYFKQGSLLEKRFIQEERRRERRAFGPSFGIREKVTEDERAATKAALETLARQEGEGEELLPRVHSADTNRDYKSLDRKGKRNVYLLLQAHEDGHDIWRFPQGGLQKGELLHEAAHRDLQVECGEHMDAWIVSRKPIGVYKPPPQDPEKLTFFFKGHIMAGQCLPQGELVKDFAWLTKQEIELRVDNHYWDGIKDMLSDY
ncbi:39S mitochondrial ribosomal protein L46-domain-containing protein [Amanita rubescens]|nr:39S mitochondrial ribosomal protein L46-domain-containing protein [Amanita rubescens]